MLKKLGALISSVALIAGVLGFASVSAGAAELPPIPTVKVNAPTSPAGENMLVVTGLEATDTSNYRFCYLSWHPGSGTNSKSRA